MERTDVAGFVDLSLPIRDGGPSYPGDPICSVVPVRSMPEDNDDLRAIYGDQRPPS